MYEDILLYHVHIDGKCPQTVLPCPLNLSSYRNEDRLGLGTGIWDMGLFGKVCRNPPDIGGKYTHYSYTYTDQLPPSFPLSMRPLTPSSLPSHNILTLGGGVFPPSDISIVAVFTGLSAVVVSGGD